MRRYRPFMRAWNSKILPLSNGSFCALCNRCSVKPDWKLYVSIKVLAMSQRSPPAVRDQRCSICALEMELLRLIMSAKISLASAIKVSNSRRIKPFFISFSAERSAQPSVSIFSVCFFSCSSMANVRAEAFCAA